jgi:hypothetical protein
VWNALGCSSSIKLGILVSHAHMAGAAHDARLAAETNGDADDAKGAEGEPAVLERALGHVGEEERGTVGVGGTFTPRARAAGVARLNARVVEHASAATSPVRAVCRARTRARRPCRCHESTHGAPHNARRRSACHANTSSGTCRVAQTARRS